MLPAVKAAHTGMAAPAPVTASDLTGIEKMERPELEAALTARGISFEPKRRLNTLRKMLAEAQGGAAAAAARPAGGSAPSSAADAFKQAFLQAGRMALRPEDITANVRSILNGGAHALPQTKASLDKVAKSLREVRAARESGDPLPGKRHRCVEECLKSDDPVMVGLMLLALQVDLDTRLQRLATLHEAAKNSAAAAAADGPGPVLSALGEDVRNRLMWEYFAKPGSSPENARSLPNMKKPKALRDALCGWCVFWTQTRPPFFRYGPRADWTAEQWEALPISCRCTRCRARMFSDIRCMKTTRVVPKRYEAVRITR